MRIQFLYEARLEFLDAITYYEDQRPGLGGRFKAEIEQSLLWLADHTEACRLRSGGYRQLKIRIFPYSIPYIVRDSTLSILAVNHERRAPEYWIKRKKETT
jgi:plasmid stabilization system protein ParE